MATIGVSKPYVAKYQAADDGTVRYTGGVCLARATEISATIDTGDNNNLYADNAVAESDKSFAGGTLTVGVDDLSQEGSMLILGVQEGTITVNGEEVTELIYDDGTVAPNLGFGCIIKKKKSNVDKWRAVVFTKIMFGIPEDAATTQGESIEWQTPSIEAQIMRDDSAKHMWKREATFSTEAQAEAYIKTVLQITDAETPKAVADSARIIKKTKTTTVQA